MNRILAGMALMLVVAAPAWAGQQSPAELTRVEVGAGVVFRRPVGVPPGLAVHWSNGLALDVTGNLNARFAVASEIETFFQGSSTVLGGAQLSTNFFYGNGRDPVPGRFFAKLLGGVASNGVTSAPALHAGGGAEVLLSRTKPIALRWEIGYRIVAANLGPRVNGVAAIGLVFGPHLSKRPFTRLHG